MKFPRSLTITVFLVAALWMGCGGQVPLTAPTGAELSISANPTAIPVTGGVSTITVTGFKGPDDGGGPLPSGTQIFLTTNVGLIEERVEMQNGVARGFLRSNGRAGLATVEARSGAGITATLANPVLIGNAQGINITVVASPPSVQPPDFTSEIVATVFDNDNNRMPGVPLIFSTSAGALASAGSVLTTNANGQAADRLTLLNETSATVTVSSGTVTGSVSVARGTTRNPIVTSVSPSITDRGITLNVTITGLNFQPGAQAQFGEGIAVNSTTFINSTTLLASITVDSAATTGARTVTVINPDGQSGSLSGVFRVGRVPIITGVNPPTSGAGNNIPLQIIGVNFAPGAFVTFSGTGVTVVTGSVSVSADGTQINLQVNISVGATGQRSVTVTNPDGGSGTLANAFEPTG